MMRQRDKMITVGRRDKRTYIQKIHEEINYKNI